LACMARVFLQHVRTHTHHPFTQIDFLYIFLKQQLSKPKSISESAEILTFCQPDAFCLGKTLGSQFFPLPHLSTKDYFHRVADGY